jgi:hypothetical protein
MTTNLFVIVYVKQLRTEVVLEFYCLFFRTSWGVGVLNSAIFKIVRVMEEEHYTVTDVFSTELGTGLSFVKTSEFRGG